MSGPSTWPAWRYLWSLVRFRGRFFALNALLWMIYYGVPLAGGLIEKAVFDALSRHAPVTYAWGLLTLMMVLYAGGMATTYGRILGDIVISFSAGALLRKNMLEYVLACPGGRALPGSPGEAVTRFRNDVGEITATLWLPVVLGVEILFGLAALTIMLRINTLITLGVLVPLLLVVLAIRVLGSRLQHYRRVSRAATGSITGFVGETLSAVQAVKVAGAQPAILTRFRELNRARLRATVRDSVFEAAGDAVYANATQVGMGVILLLAEHAMRAGSFTVGDFALFVSYLEQMTRIPLDLGTLLARLKHADVSFARMAELMPGAPPERLVRHSPVHLDGRYPEIPFHPKTEADRLQCLEVRDLTYRYPGMNRGIEGIDLSIRRGELVVITGRIGAGKSTLLRTLLGLLPADTGEVRWNDEIVIDLANFMVPPRVSYTPQVPRLFADTVRNNILLGLPSDRADLEAAVEAAELVPDVAAMAQGLDTLVGPRGVRLSGGQVQRVAAARMIVREAELMVIDDLSSALDVETEAALWKRLHRGGRSTILTVSHRPAVIHQADRIILLRDGLGALVSLGEAGL